MFKLIENHAGLWLVCAIFFLLRIVLECEGSYEFKYLVKKALKRIFFLFMLIIAWSTIYETKPSDKYVIVLLILTYFYVFTILAEKCEKTGGYTSSFLLIINCTYITFLSFVPLVGTIIGSLCILVISLLIYKYWHEKKCDLAENLSLCFETIVFAIILLLIKLEPSIYYTLLFLIIEESILDVINKGICYLVQLKYNEIDD